MRGRDIVSSTWYKIPHIESENSKSTFLKAKTTLQSTVNNLKVSIPSHTQEDLLDIIVVLAVNQQLQPWNNADLICCCQELFLNYWLSMTSKLTHRTNYLRNIPNYV
ncbi:hypothetical protein EB796_014600 [Bugula neritina]|uniref:Uncharacterized protein n=1 Tax=Bugula neritina TaxID=10212 RepID=A0A7J7JLZ6_BUGNE|nr:hypothetical protein EB796_014600 [Bugula neritina]